MRLEDFHPAAGSGVCYCARCGEVFRAVGTFEAHLRNVNGKGARGAETRCATALELTADGYHRNDSGQWVGEYTGPAALTSPAHS